MISRNNLRVVGSSPIEKVVAHFKSEGYKSSKENLTHHYSLNGLNNHYFHTPIDEGAELLRNLIESKKIPRYGLFKDAGSGDARMIASASALGLGAVGMENDEFLYLLGEANLNHLHNIKAIADRELATVSAGDFNDRASYERMGLKFIDFGTVFSNAIPHRYGKIAEKISDESRPGTTFVSINHSREHSSIHRMKVVGSEKIREKPIPFYAHVYRKRKK